MNQCFVCTIYTTEGEINPSQSIDLNIIEAVWDHLDREQNKRKKTT